MSELIPKIADIATLKGISMLLALPMLCVAYTFQTGLEISFDDSIWLAIEPGDNERLQNFKLFFIFICKSLWVSFFAGMAYSLVSYLHHMWDFPFLYVTSVVLISIAILGIFGQEKIEQLKSVEDFWFYSFIVWGIFLQTMREDLDKPFNRHTN